MQNQTSQLNLYEIIGLVVAAFSFLSYVAYLNITNRKLTAQLAESQFKNQKADDAQAIHSESPSALKSELDKDLGR
jgi:hypothetical protein